MSNETDAEIVNRLILKKKTKSPFTIERYDRPDDWDVVAEKKIAQERIENQEAEYNPFINAYSVSAAENNNLKKSRAKDHLAEKGWKRYPKPNECFYFEATCIYGCGKQVAYLTATSPNITDENYSKSTPLDLSIKDSYGNYSRRHSCLTKESVKELQYVVRRIEAVEDENRILRNRVSKQAEIINQNTRRF